MEGDDSPRKVGYFDPPYPGFAESLYWDQPTYGGEVDHAELAKLVVRYDGWAVSTSAKSLRAVLPLFPPEARVAAWVKPIGVSGKTRGPHSAWEPVIYVPARLVRPGKRDWLRAMPARGGDSELPGRKPSAFYCWLFELLGMAPQDSFADLYPGSKMGSRCWAAVSGSRSRRVLDDERVAPGPEPAKPFNCRSSIRYPNDDEHLAVMNRGRAAVGMPSLPAPGDVPAWSLPSDVPHTPWLHVERCAAGSGARDVWAVMVHKPGGPPLPPGVIGVTQAEYDAVLCGEMPERLVQSLEYSGDVAPAGERR